MRLAHGWIIGAMLAAMCSAALAQTQLSVEAGWGNGVRVGYWNPVFVTAADPKVREAQFQFTAPHDDLYTLRIAQPMALGPIPADRVVYAPMNGALNEAVVVLRDEQGRKLAETAVDPEEYRVRYNNTMTLGYDNRLIGVSGQGSTLKAVERAIGEGDDTSSRSGSVRVGSLKAAWLPDTPIGYDPLAVLVLSGADLSLGISAQQQNAIVEWVRGGGRLILWLAETPQPDDAPLARILPCRVGDVVQLTLTEEQLRSAGLSPNLTLRGRQLAARPGASTVTLLGDGQMVTGRVGFGQVAVLAMDPSRLTFRDTERAQAFWTTIFSQGAANPFAGRGGAYQEDSARSTAVSNVMDRLGDVPGLGSFDFTYVALVLAAMMLIVGPVDWFVLKRLGRQPWTWATTGGWVALVTLGAIYIGHVVKSGDLHFRTLRVIDQADDVVGTSDFAMIYSPRTDDYLLETEARSWWEPAETAAYYSRSAGMLSMDAIQDWSGNRLGLMRINVWNLRGLRGQAWRAPGEQGPLIRADLRLERSRGQQVVAGTITNLASVPLGDVRVRTKAGWVQICPGTADQIAPGQTLAVGAQMTPAHERGGPTVHSYPGRYRQGYEGPLLTAAGDLAIRRSVRLDDLIDHDDGLACIYAQADNAPPAAKLATAHKAIEKHYLVIRALVEIK